MKLQAYFDNKFPQHLRRLRFRRPNRIVREEMMGEHHVIFFGGQDWRSADKDLSSIPFRQRPHFILSLFLITVTDQCLHAYYRDQYPKWKRLTHFPKFGWSGFGYHIENPLKILWKPEKDELVDIEDVLNMMPAFIELVNLKLEEYFNLHFPKISTDDFLQNIINDKDLKFDQGEVVQTFKTQLKGLHQQQVGE